MRFPKKRFEGERNQRALVYFKTSPFWTPDNKFFTHPNICEVHLVVEALVSRGFETTVIDRSAKPWQVAAVVGRKSWEFFISNAAGNSAPLHGQIMGAIQAKHKVLYAAGPEKTFSHHVTLARHENFRLRTGFAPAVRRLVEPETNYLSGICSILYLGESESQRFKEFSAAPVFELPSAVDYVPELGLDEVKAKSAENFVYMGGSGHIAKGLDLVIEAFAKLPQLRLDIFANLNEKDFWSAYETTLKNCPNISVHGFVDVKSNVFRDITARAGFNVFPSAAEANATSIIALMRRGLLPITTRSVGPASAEKLGFILDEEDLDLLPETIVNASKLPQADLVTRSQQVIQQARLYSRDTYMKSLLQALDKVSEGECLGHEK